MATPPIVRDKLVHALNEFGPMTAAELAAASGVPLVRVHACLAQARTTHERRIFRIAAWRSPLEENRSGKHYAIFALGSPNNRADAPRPEWDPVEAKRAAGARFREANRAKLRAMFAQRRAKERGDTPPVAATNPFAQLLHAVGTAVVHKPRTNKLTTEDNV